MYFLKISSSKTVCGLQRFPNVRNLLKKRGTAPFLEPVFENTTVFNPQETKYQARSSEHWPPEIRRKEEVG